MGFLNVVIVSQEFESSNHRDLWYSLSNINCGKVIIIDIPVDLFITIIKKKNYRFKDHKKGIRKLGSNIFVYRPLFFFRPEILPKIFHKFISSTILKLLIKINAKSFEKINFIVYDPVWVEILNHCKVKKNIYYYIYDEYYYFANNEKLNKKKKKQDNNACIIADHILVMSDFIKNRRIEYKNKITVIGNGAVKIDEKINFKIENSVAFVGVFRDWIDKLLLEELIKKRPDLLFCFVGPIEKNMKVFFLSLLNNYLNTLYFGCVKKNEVLKLFKVFKVVIVPYKQNLFISSSRPIKIVESIFAGTPVVTIPVNGYNESNFIKFSTNSAEFSKSIDELLKYDFISDNIEYQDFINQNSWESKAFLINRILINENI